jgi:hypothetical protein
MRWPLIKHFKINRRPAGVFGPFVRWSWTVIKSIVRLTAMLYVAYRATEMFGLRAGVLSASAMYYFLSPARATPR